MCQVWSHVEAFLPHQEQAPFLQVLELIPNLHMFPFSIKAKYLRVVLGAQDLKKTECHEQTFRVEKIIQYSDYNENDEIPHNDIGKSPLGAMGYCSGWVYLLVEGELRPGSQRCS